MTGLMIKADNVLLEQIACIAENLAHRDGKEIKIESFNDERYKSYEKDALAIKNGKMQTYSIEEVLDEIEKWY